MTMLGAPNVPLRMAIQNRDFVWQCVLVLNAVLLAIVAVWLRGWQLANIPGVNGDEAWSGVWAWRFAHAEPVEWVTPTGNLVNVFFLLPMAILHAIWSP